MKRGATGILGGPVVLPMAKASLAPPDGLTGPFVYLIDRCLG